MDMSGEDSLYIAGAVLRESSEESIDIAAYNTAVVLNRVLSDKYPNTIKEVAEEKADSIPEWVLLGMEQVILDGWDETKGDLDYK